MPRVPSPRDIWFRIGQRVRGIRLRRPRLPHLGAPRLPRPRLRPLLAGARAAWYALVEWLRGIRYALEDLAYIVGRLLRALARGVRAFWLGLDVYTRRRLGAAAVVVGVLAAIWLAVVPALPCEFPAGDVCPPADHAIGLVPADALAYVHLNVDPGTDQYAQAAALASRLPTIASSVADRLEARLPGPGGAPADFQSQIRPWFGGEAALALLPSGPRGAEEVDLVQASSEDGARKFASSIASGRTQTATEQGVQITTDARGLATALAGGFLLIGRERGVREVIDAATGADGARSLADSSEAGAALASLPGFRLADAYVSEDGISRLVDPPRSPLSQLAPFVDPGASTGFAAALVASDQGLEVQLRSVLDPDRAKAQPSFFSALPAFAPTLAAKLSPDSLAYVGIGDPGTAISSLVSQAQAEQPGLAAAFSGLVKRVQKVGGLNLESDLLPSLGAEAALALEPAPTAKTSGGSGGGGGNVPPIGPQLQTPFLEFIGSGVDEHRAREALARLQAPIAKALGGNQLQAPSFTQTRVAGVAADSLRLSPTVDLTYAIFDSLLVVATDSAGVDQVASGSGGLDATDGFRAATSGFPAQPSLLVYLNLTGLVSLAEQAGLAQDPAYVTFAPEIRRLEGLGISVSNGSTELDTDVRLVVGG